MQADSIQSFLIEDWHLRGHIVRLNKCLHEIMSQHAYPDMLSQFLGKILSSTCLLASSIKFSGELTLQIQSDGALKLLVAKSDHLFHLRGLAQWDQAVLPNELAQALGEGQLVVTLNLNDSPQPYQSIIKLVNHSIEDSLQQYFLVSEQLPSKLWLFSDEQAAYGVLIQALPNTQQEQNWQQALALWKTFDIKELSKQSNDALFNDLANLCQLRLFPEQEIKFQCHCSEQRMARSLKTLGYEEVQMILKEQDSVFLTCEFCSQQYDFDHSKIHSLFN